MFLLWLPRNNNDKITGYQAAEAVHILKIAQNDFKAELPQLKLTPIICLLLGLK